MINARDAQPNKNEFDFTSKTEIKEHFRARVSETTEVARLCAAYIP